MKRPPTLDRRIFLKNSLFASAFLGFGPSAYSFSGLIPSTHSFLGTESVQNKVVKSERFVPVSIVWDVANLIMKDRNKSWKMMDSVSERFNRMVSGSVLQKNRQYLPEILTEIMEGNGWSEEIHPQVALFCGFLVHDKIEKAFAELQSDTKDDRSFLYRDCAILKLRINRETSGSGANPTKAEIADFLKQLYHRATFRTHTLTPDTQDWERWLVDYIDWYNADRRYLEELAEIYLKDDDQFQKHGAGTSFFDTKDELFRIANDYSVREIELSPTFVNNAKGDSLYARALADAILAVKSLDELFEGKIEKEKFRKMHNI